MVKRFVKNGFYTLCLLDSEGDGFTHNAIYQKTVDDVAHFYSDDITYHINLKTRGCDIETVDWSWDDYNETGEVQERVYRYTVYCANIVKGWQF